MHSVEIASINKKTISFHFRIAAFAEYIGLVPNPESLDLH
jgi:hypothetical protein